MWVLRWVKLNFVLGDVSCKDEYVIYVYIYVFDVISWLNLIACKFY